MYGPERESRAPNPIRQRRAIERDALPGVDLRLAIERQVVGIFGDQHMRDQRLGRNAVLDQPLRRRGLYHLPAIASIFGTPRHNHLELRRDHVEPFGDVFANAVLEAAAA